MQLAFNFIKKKFELSFKRKRRSLFLTTTDTTTDKKKPQKCTHTFCKAITLNAGFIYCRAQTKQYFFNLTISVVFIDV